MNGFFKVFLTLLAETLQVFKNSYFFKNKSNLPDIKYGVLNIGI